MEVQTDTKTKVQLEHRDKPIRKQKLIPSLLDLDFSLKSRDTAGKIIELYTIFLLTIYPVFLLKDESLGISVKMLLFYAITISVLFASILLAMDRHFTFRRPERMLDYTVIAIAGVNLILVPVKLLSGRADYTKNLLVVAFVICFYLLSCGFVFYHYYIDIFLFSGAVVMIQLLVHYTMQPAYEKPVALLLEDSHALTCFLLLLALVAGAEYLGEKQKENDIFYLTIAGVAFFLLFIGQNRAGVLIGLLGVTLMPICLPYTAEQLKRGIILLFLYLFLYSNMSLIAGYSGILQVETHFPLSDSVYLDLFMAAVGAVFFFWWDRQSWKEPLELVKLPNAGRLWRCCAIMEGLLFGIMILGGKRLSELGSDLERSIGNFGMAVLGELSAGRNVFLESAVQMGIWGMLLMAVLWIFFAEQVWKRKQKGTEPALMMGALLALLCSPVLEMQETTAPLFAVLGAYALYGQQEKAALANFPKKQSI